MTTYLHYSMIDEDDIWFPGPGEIPTWLRIGKRPSCLFYKKGDLVTCEGLAFASTVDYNVTSPVWPSPQNPRDWAPCSLVALPYRQGSVYADGAIVYSTSSGAVWIYDEPSEEWCLMLTLSHERRAELRARRLGKTHREVLA